MLQPSYSCLPTCLRTLALTLFRPARHNLWIAPAFSQLPWLYSDEAKFFMLDSVN